MIKIAKYHHKKIILAFIALLLGAGMVFATPLPTFAQEQPKIRECTEEDTKNPNPASPCLPAKIKPTTNSAVEKKCSQGESCTVTRILSDSGLVQMFINPLIRTLTAIIGVVIVIAIVISGIQYSASGGDPSKVAAAKKRIMNVILALLAYIFMAAFINWLLPGGLVGA